MAGPGGDKLGYNLYTTAARNVIWGDGTAGTVTLPTSPSASPVTVYGRIFMLQSARAGSYSDTIIATFNF